MTINEKYSEENKQIAGFCKALAHPARIAIIKLLLKIESCYCGDIVKELPLAQSTVSQHLKELKKAGLIKGNITPPQVKYCVDQDNIRIAMQTLKNSFDI